MNDRFDISKGAFSDIGVDDVSLCVHHKESRPRTVVIRVPNFEFIVEENGIFDAQCNHRVPDGDGTAAKRIFRSVNPDNTEAQTVVFFTPFLDVG